MGKEMPIVDRGGHTLGYGFEVKNPGPSKIPLSEEGPGFRGLHKNAEPKFLPVF